jgi:hypothetical protein
LSKELPFVEKELIEKNMANLKREFKIENFEVPKLRYLNDNF